MSIAPKLLQKIWKHSSDVTSLDFYGSSLLVTGSSDKTVRLWRWEVGHGFTEDTNSPFLGHKYAVTQAVFSPKGSVVASASVDGCIILWDIATGQKTDVLHQPNSEAVRNCMFAPDGSCIASTDDTGTICIFGQDKILKKTIRRVHEETIPTLAFSKDSKLMLTACTMGNVRVFFNDFEADLIEPDLLIDNAHDMGCMSADFCKVSRLDPVDANTTIYTLATSGNDNKIKIWRVYAILDQRPSRRGSNASTSEVRSSSRLISTSLQQHFAETATIFPTLYLNTECVHSFVAHGSSVHSVRFNLKGTLLVSGGLDRLVKIWNMQGSCMKTLDEHQRYVNCISINFDSTLVASGSNDKSVLIWDLTGSFTLDSHIANGLKSLLFSLTKDEVSVAEDFICPITHEIMSDPVMIEDGFTYERSAILEWFSKEKITSPMTNCVLTSTEVYENSKLKGEIENYLKKLDIDPFE